MTTETVGERIRATRERLGITQSDLADRVGVRQPTMWRYEAREMVPGSEVLVAIARELNVSEHWLIHGEEAVDPETGELPDPPYFREFLEKYEHAKDLTADDLRAMKVYAGRTRRVRSWTDWEQLAEWRRKAVVVTAPSAKPKPPEAEEAEVDEGPPIDPYAGGGAIDPYEGTPKRKR